jgi:uncharacterized protein with GYD domain
MIAHAGLPLRARERSMAEGTIGGFSMAKYLLEVKYTQDAIKALKADGGSARLAAATAAAESVGGTIEAYYFAFGGTDVYAIGDFPDDVSAASLALTVAAAGGVTVKTVVLLTPEEIDEAAAKSVSYSPPGT